MLKQAARNLLPRGAWKRLRTAREAVELRRLHAAWIEAQRGLTPVDRAAGGPARVLLIPSDPVHIAGSCGDDAMVSAIARMAAEAYPGGQIDVLVWDRDSSAAADALGFRPIPIWNQGDFVGRALEALKTGGYSATVGMGADIIDGIYGALDPAKQLVALDLATRLGIPSAVLGCSFSTRPDARLKVFFDDLDPAVRVCIRDAVSLERARAFTSASTELVADSAFMLQPTQVDEATLAWIAARRAEGRAVIGFNVHPMLLDRLDGDAENQLIRPAFKAITRIHAGCPVAWLLIPHDRRADCGDNSVLEPLYDRLKGPLGDDVAIFGGFRRAAELKAVAGAMDGVVTGRMHLAIASLGQGTPVMCVTYQDKFEGLLSHFDLPQEALISLPQFNDLEVAAGKIETFLDTMPAMRARVAETRPAVIEQARRNFAHFG